MIEPTWNLESPAGYGYEEVADKFSACKTGVRRCSEEDKVFRASVRYEETQAEDPAQLALALGLGLT